MVTRLDELTVGAVQRSLEYQEAKVIEKKYPDYKFADGRIVPIEELDIPWAETTSYKMMTGVGSFELARDYTTNVPMVDVLSEEFFQRTYKFIGGYSIGEDEALKAAHNNQPIEEQKISVVRRVQMQTLNRQIAFGESTVNMPGFLNHPAWLRAYALYPLNSASTANQVLATLQAPGTSVRTITKGVETVDTMLLPLKQYEYLINARLDNTLEKTILRQFLDNNGQVKNIEPCYELEGAGPNGEDIMVVYRRDPEVMKARLTQPFGFRPLVQQPFGYMRPAAYKYGGIIPYLPYAVHVTIGI